MGGGDTRAKGGGGEGGLVGEVYGGREEVGGER